MKGAVFKNLHLAISVALIIPIALAYGVCPSVVLSKLFNIKVETANLANVFRAMMGLYLGMSATWVMGILHQKHWATATLVNVAFMGGLASGRLLSLVLDGLPSMLFLIGLILEAALAYWGLKNLKKYP